MRSATLGAILRYYTVSFIIAIPLTNVWDILKRRKCEAVSLDYFGLDVWLSHTETLSHSCLQNIPVVHKTATMLHYRLLVCQARF